MNVIDERKLLLLKAAKRLLYKSEDLLQCPLLGLGERRPGRQSVAQRLKADVTNECDEVSTDQRDTSINDVGGQIRGHRKTVAPPISIPTMPTLASKGGET